MNDPLKPLPGYALRRASSAMLADLSARLAPLDLRTTEASILVLIEANDGIKQSELCKILDIQRANMTPIIARLEARLLITRTAVDGRSQGLTLSISGQNVVLQIKDAMTAHEAYLVARIPAEHLGHFLPALSALWNG